MPELGFIVYLIAISYGMGVVWYALLGRNNTNWMRMAAFPLLGVIIGEALWTNHIASNPNEGLLWFDLHIYVVLISSFVGSLVDVALGWVAKEHPMTHYFKALEHSQQD